MGCWQEIRHANGKVDKIPIEDRCAKCNIKFKAFEMLGDWAFVKDKVNGDQEWQSDWLRAGEVAESGIVPWFNASVGVERRGGVMIKVKLRGLKPIEFQIIYLKAHDVLGFRLQLLPDPSGAKFQGLLVHDAGQCKGVGTRYAWYLDVAALLNEEQMDSNTRLRRSQPVDTFSFLTRPQAAGGKEDPLMKQVRLTALSQDLISERIQQVDAGNDIPASQEPDEAEDGADDDAPTVMNVEQVSLRDAPATPPRAKKARGSRSSGATSTLDPGDPSSPTTIRVNSISLDELVSGRNRS